MLDQQRFPRARAYLDQLPEGLDSFRACRVKFDAVEGLLTRCPQLRQEAGLPQAVRDTLDGRPGSWHPEAAVMVITLMARDVAFASDEEMMRFTYDSSIALFDRVLYRALMKLMSPTLLVMGSSRRWTTFRAGTQLRALSSRKQGTKMVGEVVLTHPPLLFPELFLESLCPAFRAALDLSRGRGVDVRIGARQPDETHYRLAWDD